MQKFSTPFKVGFVILVGLVMAVVMIIRFSANWGQDNGTYELKAYFNDATGLAPKSQIKVAGIQVGEVSSIRLEGSRALVTFKIRDDIELWSGTGNENDLVNGATVAKKLSAIITSKSRRESMEKGSKTATSFRLFCREKASKA